MGQIDLSQIKDFKYYAEHLLKIKTEKRQVVPLIFNTEQERLHKIWEYQLKTMGMVRLIVLKDRRIGISTYIEGRLFHQTVTIPLTSSYIVTHDKPSLQKIFAMSKLYYDELPKTFRPMKRYSNKTELVFENPNEKARFYEPGLRSSIEVFSANTGTASRSGGYSIAHFSEVAFYENAEDLITSTVPSIQDLPGTIKVYESTGNGRSGFFYEQWRKAKKSLQLQRKLSNFFPVFFGWLTFPEYTKPFLKEQDQIDLLGTLDEEEVYLQRKFKATPEQLNWRRSKILDFDGDVDKFHQEYPADDEEAFISRGIPYFSKQRLLHLLTCCKPPLQIGDVGLMGFEPDENGYMKVWEPPLQGEDYILAADVGEGVEHGDPSTIEVLKLPKGEPRITQVAEWKGLIDPVMFAGKLKSVCEWYNDGMAVPEVGRGPGLTTLSELKNIYWNIYQWQFLDRYKHFQSVKLGWETNISTKPIICTYASACLNADILEIYSEDLVEEMLSFVRNTNGSAEADYNCHDDLVMAYIIGVFAVSRSSQAGSLLQQMGKSLDKSSTMIDKTKPKYDPSKHDMAWMEDEDLVESGDRSWLNY